MVEMGADMGAEKIHGAKSMGVRFSEIREDEVEGIRRRVGDFVRQGYRYCT